MNIRNYTFDQDKWLAENYYISYSYDDLTESFNRIFACSKTKSGIAQHCTKALGLKGLGDKNHYTKDQEYWLRVHHSMTETYDDLAIQFNLYFGASRTRDQIREKCNKGLGLKGKPSLTTYGNKEKEQLPVGTIRKSQTGTYIKVLNVPHKTCFSGYAEPYWMPLQKKIYQDAHGKIGTKQMICFLDGNTENFELDNLYCIDRKISAIMSKNGWWTDSKEHTLTAIKWCELYYIIKEINYENIDRN